MIFTDSHWHSKDESPYSSIPANISPRGMLQSIFTYVIMNKQLLFFFIFLFFINFIGNSTENYIQNTMRQNKKEESRKGQKGVSNGTEVPMLPISSYITLGEWNVRPG